VSLAAKARAAAIEQRRRDALHAQQPSELQERVARDLADLLGEQIDPLIVREHGYHHPYCPCTVEAFGLTFKGHYLWGGGDWRYHRTSSPWLVERRRFGIKRERAVDTLADLDGWLDDAPGIAPIDAPGGSRKRAS
jgi:hypothetical protein